MVSARARPPLRVSENNHYQGQAQSATFYYRINRHDRQSSMGAPSVSHAHASNGFVVLVVLSYGLSSLGGVFVNKACLSSFDFKYSITIMLCQLLVSVTALTILRFFRVVTIPKRSWKDLSVLIFPAVFFIANVTVGLLALRLVNIPMFSAFRRLSVLNVMLLEWFVLDKTASRRVLFTVSVMVLGSFLAGLGDITFNGLGYCLVFLNNFITGANLVSIKKATSIVRLDALALFYYVSAISLPIVFLLALLSGELRLALDTIASRPDLQTVSFTVALSLSAGSAFLINFFTNLCTQLTSPLTTAITGQMKNVLQTILGIFAFGYRVTPLNLFGLAIALGGSLLFAFYKYEDASNARAARSAAERHQGAPSPNSTDSDLSDASQDQEKSELLWSNALHGQGKSRPRTEPKLEV